MSTFLLTADLTENLVTALAGNPMPAEVVTALAEYVRDLTDPANLDPDATNFPAAAMSEDATTLRHLHNDFQKSLKDGSPDTDSLLAHLATDNDRVHDLVTAIPVLNLHTLGVLAEIIDKLSSAFAGAEIVGD